MDKAVFWLAENKDKALVSGLGSWLGAEVQITALYVAKTDHAGLARMLDELKLQRVKIGEGDGKMLGFGGTSTQPTKEAEVDVPAAAEVVAPGDAAEDGRVCRYCGTALKPRQLVACAAEACREKWSKDRNREYRERKKQQPPSDPSLKGKEPGNCEICGDPLTDPRAKVCKKKACHQKRNNAYAKDFYEKNRLGLAENAPYTVLQGAKAGETASSNTMGWWLRDNLLSPGDVVKHATRGTYKIIRRSGKLTMLRMKEEAKSG
jgi:hypothetical protein